MFYIHTDHLNAPSKITRPSDNAVIWRWDHDPFGNGTPNQDPDGNGLQLTMNLRFPGQYFDQETGLYYNMARDYDPATGRYVEADPVTVREHALLEVILPLMAKKHGREFKQTFAELSPYAYVANNPISRVDPTGEDGGDGGGNGGGGASGDLCPLVAQFNISMRPKVNLSVWYCIYDCNTSCPGSMSKLHTEIQWDVPPHTGCYKVISRPK